MPVPSTIADLSTTAASNSPAGTESIGTNLDNYLRAVQAIVKQNASKGVDIASASNIAIPDAGSYFVVTGTTTIATITDSWNGRLVVLKFSGALQLTQSANLILPNGANITTVAGDVIALVNESTGVYRTVVFQPYSGYATKSDIQNQSGVAYTTGGTSTAYTLTPSPAVTALAENQEFDVEFHTAAGATPTLAVSGLTAKSLKYRGSTGALAAVTSIQVPSGWRSKVTDDGTDYIVREVPPAAASVAQIQPISASVEANALTISASALSLDFRSATLGSGTVTSVSGTPSNLVISSGSTLGTVSGVKSRIVVLAINNAGTIELAAVNITGGVDLSETGLISTTAEGGAGAADSASVIYSTTARTNVAYRVIGYIESTQATAGTWATAPSTIQGNGGQALIRPSSGSMVRLNTSNGFGSTATAIYRFTNTVTNQGSDITYADSATDGASFTINTSGVYSISFTANYTAQNLFGISLNASSLTTDIGALTITEIITFTDIPWNNLRGNCSATLYLSAGDVVRAHRTTTASVSSAAQTFFTITRVA